MRRSVKALVERSSSWQNFLRLRGATSRYLISTLFSYISFCRLQDLELTLKNFLGPMREAGESLPTALRGKVRIVMLLRMRMIKYSQLHDVCSWVDLIFGEKCTFSLLCMPSTHPQPLMHNIDDDDDVAHPCRPNVHHNIS